MAHKEKANETHVCPKTGRPINTGKYRWFRWVLPLTGLVSLLWFLVRVIPKPSRATYPCQRMAAPLASGFIVWLLGIIGSSLAYRKARKLFSQSRYLMAVVCIGVAVAAIWWSLSITNSDPAGAAAIPDEPPNSPIGVAKGINPGRVVWVRDTDATSWDGSTGKWWDDENTNQEIVNYMVRKAIRALTGESDDIQAWDALFRHFNQTNGFGDIGYQYGEKIAIKINLNQDSGGSWSSSAGMPSPHVVYAFLEQLINVVGIPGSAITVYDASRYIGDPIYEKVRSNPDPNFQSVTFVVAPDLARNGRIGADHDPSEPVYTNAGTAYLPRCVTEAKYLVNMALLRPHTGVGITLCAKNHFGSVRFLSSSRHQGWTPEPLHNYGGRNKPMDTYNCLVELNGHRHLAGKTLLYFIDGLYPAVHESSNVIKWESFGDDWFSSVLVSQDPVAIDSVGFDFLRNEPRCTQVIGHPENYLHEMALADNPPSGTFYDPERDGIGLTSMGVHEHWNNAVDKQYSRNLRSGRGIELITASLTPIVDFNNDGIVDSADMCIMVDHWGENYSLCNIGPTPLGDGIVDFRDLVVLTEHWLADYRLIAHWKLDETEGTIAYDSVGSNDGTLNGDPNWQPTAGKVDGTLKFNGTDNYISTDFVLNPVSGSFSVFAWIKGGAPGQVIISQADRIVGRFIHLGSTWLGTDASDGTLITTLMYPHFDPLESEYMITDGQWHHVGLVYDLDEFHRYLYVDEVEVAKDTSIVGGASSDGGLYIGASKALEEGSFFSGLIDNVRIYNVALSAKEIAELVR